MEDGRNREFLGSADEWNSAADLIKDYLEATSAKKVKPSATPGTPGRTLIKNEGDAVMESKYRKMVGKLLWIVKKESP